jgi:16S rRNA processing protein RimM
VARIVRPHGVRGEVAAEILTDFPERLLSLKRAFLWDGGASLREVDVRLSRVTPNRGGRALFQFAGCDSMDQARKLVGWQVQIPLADRVQLPHGHYFVTDLIGCTVREENGATLGEVTGVQAVGENVLGTPVLVVRSASGELLIPMAEEICIRIAPESREVVVCLPEGLRELNES